MSEKRVTTSFLKWVLQRLRATFVSAGAAKLMPGAKINGVLFTGNNDIEVAPSPLKDIIVLPGRSIGIFYDNNCDAGWILKNDGFYFCDGENEIPVVTASKDEETGKYSVSTNIEDNAEERTIGFVLPSTSATSNSSEETTSKRTIGF